MIIQHNLSAMNADRQLGITKGRRGKSAEKLSSGYKINRAADDAAGLAISEKMRRQIRGLTQASANCMDGISLVQVADGAMAEIHDMLHRGSELSIKAANDTLTTDDREYIQSEINQILEEIDSIKDKATFNEIKVLCGGEGPASNYNVSDGAILVGNPLPDYVQSPALNAGYMNDVYVNNRKKYPAGTIDFTGVTADNVQDLIGTAFNIDCSTCSNKYTFSFTEGTGNSTVISGSNYIYKIGVEGVTNGNDLVNRIIAAAGTKPADHYTTLENQNGVLLMHENRDWPGEQDLDRYQKQSRVLPGEAYAADDLEEGGGVYDLLIQAGADEGQTIPIKLPNVDRSLMGLSVVDVTRKGDYSFTTGSYSEATGYSSGQQVTATVDGPADAIERFKNALEYVSNERSRMGAAQNRLEHAIKNLDNIVENTTASETLIRDTDMASEMQKYSNTDIIAQAGQSILAQANQSKQGVLSLLQ